MDVTVRVKSGVSKMNSANEALDRVKAVYSFVERRLESADLAQGIFFAAVVTLAFVGGLEWMLGAVGALLAALPLALTAIGGNQRDHRRVTLLGVLPVLIFLLYVPYLDLLAWALLVGYLVICIKMLREKTSVKEELATS